MCLVANKYCDIHRYMNYNTKYKFMCLVANRYCDIHRYINYNTKYKKIIQNVIQTIIHSHYKMLLTSM